MPLAWLLPKPWADLPPLPAAPAFALGWLGSLALLIWGWRQVSSRRVAVAFAGTAALAMVYLHLIALPAVEAYRDEKPLAARIRARLGGDLAGLALYQTRQPVFYLAAPGPLAEFDAADELRPAIRSGAVRWLLGRARDLQPLGRLGRVLEAEATQPWEGAAGRADQLHLVLVELSGKNEE